MINRLLWVFNAAQWNVWALDKSSLTMLPVGTSVATAHEAWEVPYLAFRRHGGPLSEADL